MDEPPRRAKIASAQNLIHALEQGRFAALLWLVTGAVVLLAVALMYVGWKFRGFASADAMDQAQVAREIARGHGWNTKFIRPLALWQQEKNTGAVPQGNSFPDTFNAPLPPLLNALPIKLSLLINGDMTEYKRGQLITYPEQYIVGLSMLCFLGAVLVQYFLLRRLFDVRIAFWASLLTLLSDLCWSFTLTGLPQMLMLLLFNCALYVLLRAVQAEQAVADYAVGVVPAGQDPANVVMPSRSSALKWLAAAGVFFGLLLLSHALTVWLLLGAALYVGMTFRQRVPAVAVLLGVAVLLYAPWLVRNYQVSGNPTGLAGYTLFDGAGITTSQSMRSPIGPGTEGIQLYFFRAKVQGGIAEQISNVLTNLGGNPLAILFFLCVLHAFRRKDVGRLRNAVLLIWAFAVFGSALGGDSSGSPLGANRIMVLFLPVMLGYGLALALVLFGRLERSNNGLIRAGMYAVFVVLAALPMLNHLMGNEAPHQYPPYLEPVVALLNDWTVEEEVVASDMPWAVAWYADRKSLWIPVKYRDMTGLSDDGKLSGPLAGLLLTPVTRNLSYGSALYKGEFEEYTPLALGSTNVPYFPYKEVALPMGDLSYIFYSDRKRWEKPKTDG